MSYLIAPAKKYRVISDDSVCVDFNNRRQALIYANSESKYRTTLRIHVYNDTGKHVAVLLHN